MILFGSRRWSFSRLEQSTTARRFDIPNFIPSELRARARVLGEFAAYLEDHGFRVTSAFRSHDLTLAIREANAERSGSSSILQSKSAHTSARALDVGAPKGAARDRATFTALRAQLLADPFLGPYIQKALIEGDHVHLQFIGARMDELAPSVS